MRSPNLYIFMWELLNVLLWLGHAHIKLIIMRCLSCCLCDLYNEKDVWFWILDRVIDHRFGTWPKLTCMLKWLCKVLC